MFKLISSKKIVAFFVMLSLLVAYMPMAIFAASAATVSVSKGAIAQNEVELIVTITDNGSTVSSGTLSYTAVSPATGGGSKTINGSDSYFISGLTAGATYDYTVEIPYGYYEDNDPPNPPTLVPAGNATFSGSFTTASPPAITPPTVTTSSVTLSGTSSIVASGTLTDNGSTISEKGFVYSTNATPTVSNGTRVAGNLSGTALTATFTPSASGTYYVCAYATYSGGANPVYGTIFNVTTSAAVTAPTFRTDAATSVTATTATANVYVSAIGSGYSKAGVVYSTNSSLLTAWDRNGTSYKERSTNNEGNKDFALTGLSPNTTYYMKGYVYANGVYTYDPIATPPSFKTPAATAPTGVSVTIDSKTASACDIIINVTSNGGSPITSRGILYSTSSSTLTINSSNMTKKTVSNETGGAGSSTISLTGLSADTTYYVRAFAINGVSSTPTYSNQTSFRTSAGTSAYAPSATTSAITNITATTAEVPIDITSTGGSNYTITERGVVYSKTNSSPEVDGSKCDIEVASGKTTGKTTVVLTGLEPGTKYYACAYAENSRGEYGYGTVRTFTTLDEDDAPTVLTVSVSRVSETEMDVVINVTDQNASKVTERGVVYSRTNRTPTTSDSIKKASSAGEGKTTVNLTGLVSNASYYVRAYAKNSYGTSYGAVKTLGDDDDAYVSTNSVVDITGTSATVGGNVPSSSNSDVKERGVVYSRTVTSPTVSDERIRSDKTTYGSYSLSITGLENNTRYYTRAYVRTTDNEYHYGSVMSFVTTDVNLTVTVLYKTVDGQQVGSQNIAVSTGGYITETSLSVPYGYSLVNPIYLFTASETTTTTVTVRAGNQGAFMEGSSNYLFEPDKKITRIEVARMIYNLKGKVYAGEGIAFSDMPTAAADIAAVKYVSAMKYMIGNPDNTFKPYANITRAEVVVIGYTVYGYRSTDLNNPFSDTAKHWAKDYITIAYRNNSLSGYPDGTFKPDANMTRAEAASVFTRAEKRDLSPIGTAQFTDVPRTHWAYKYIMNAAVPRQ